MTVKHLVIKFGIQDYQVDLNLLKNSFNTLRIEKLELNSKLYSLFAAKFNVIKPYINSIQHLIIDSDVLRIN